MRRRNCCSVKLWRLIIQAFLICIWNFSGCFTAVKQAGCGDADGVRLGRNTSRVLQWQRLLSGSRELSWWTTILHMIGYISVCKQSWHLRVRWYLSAISVHIWGLRFYCSMTQRRLVAGHWHYGKPTGPIVRGRIEQEYRIFSNRIRTLFTVTEG